MSPWPQHQRLVFMAFVHSSLLVVVMVRRYCISLQPPSGSCLISVAVGALLILGGLGLFKAFAVSFQEGGDGIPTLNGNENVLATALPSSAY